MHDQDTATETEGLYAVTITFSQEEYWQLRLRTPDRDVGVLAVKALAFYDGLLEQAAKGYTEVVLRNPRTGDEIVSRRRLDAK
jgi:hypothetical protein